MHEPSIAMHKASRTRISVINRALPTVKIITLSTQRTISIKVTETHNFKAQDSILIYLSAKQ